MSWTQEFCVMLGQMSNGQYNITHMQNEQHTVF